MYNYASLKAEQDVLREYKRFNYQINENISDKEALSILRAHKSLKARDILLQRDSEHKSEDEALIFCYAELAIGQRINREVWSSGRVSYNIGLQNRSVIADGSDLGALVLNKSILEGYTYTEKVGEHFIVTGPNKGIYVTNGKSCSCENKACLHSIGVTEIISNRRRTNNLYKILS